MKNQTESGKTHFSVTFSRSYLKDDEWHTAQAQNSCGSRASQAAYGEIQRQRNTSSKKPKKAA